MCVHLCLCICVCLLPSYAKTLVLSVLKVLASECAARLIFASYGKKNRHDVKPLKRSLAAV